MLRKLAQKHKHEQPRQPDKQSQNNQSKEEKKHNNKITEIKKHCSLITLNINDLNLPIKKKTKQQIRFDSIRLDSIRLD